MACAGQTGCPRCSALLPGHVLERLTISPVRRSISTMAVSKRPGGWPGSRPFKVTCQAGRPSNRHLDGFDAIRVKAHLLAGDLDGAFAADLRVDLRVDLRRPWPGGSTTRSVWQRPRQHPARWPPGCAGQTVRRGGRRSRRAGTNTLQASKNAAGSGGFPSRQTTRRRKSLRFRSRVYKRAYPDDQSGSRGQVTFSFRLAARPPRAADWKLCESIG